MSKDNKNANIYLNKFSYLLRSTLDQSKLTFIPLSQVIEYIRNYLEMEKLRFDHFNFSIETDPALHTESIMVAPMLLQPIVENAIWHGLMNKPYKGKLKLSFEKENGSIRCVVEDNGVGRKKAAEIGEQNSIKRKSYGMTISQKRMELLQKENLDIPEIQVEDLGVNGHAGAGTRVTIHFQVD